MHDEAVQTVVTVGLDQVVLRPAPFLARADVTMVDLALSPRVYRQSSTCFHLKHSNSLEFAYQKESE